jgi:hypothetical protein
MFKIQKKEGVSPPTSSCQNIPYVSSFLLITFTSTDHTVYETTKWGEKEHVDGIIISMIKWKVWNVACVGEMRYANEIAFNKRWWKETLGRLKSTLHDNIKMGLKVNICDILHWILVTWDGKVASFCEQRGTYWLVEELSASQWGLCSAELAMELLFWTLTTRYSPQAISLIEWTNKVKFIIDTITYSVI